MVVLSETEPRDRLPGLFERFERACGIWEAQRLYDLGDVALLLLGERWALEQIERMRRGR